jgi:dynein heavy chain
MDHMYQFSLKYFKNLFNMTIIAAEKSDIFQTRIDTLCTDTTYNIFSNVSRGLFEQHKMIYAFMICCGVLKEAEYITEHEWNFYLRGNPSSLDSEVSMVKPPLRWLSEAMWKNCCDLSICIPQFGYILEHMTLYPSEWESIIESETPFTDLIPGDTTGQLTDFQRLLLLKVLREEKLATCVSEFIRKNIGQEFVVAPPLELGKAYKDTSNRTPMIFILSPGSDPINSLVKFASTKEMNMQEKMHLISLGQGQGPIAEELVRKAMVSGEWVFLQNCHLAASWMNRLETIVKDFSSPELELDKNFRLFLSSMPSPIFPTAVLQESVKVTNEPPKGLRANLAQSFANVSRDLFDDNPPQGSKFRKLLFGVCFFNAVILERKKFGPLGWNISYDWSNADLEVSITILKNTLTEQNTIPWDALVYLTGEITFGGRVTDDWDRRTLEAILKKYYCPEILDDGYKLSSTGIYYAPNDGELSTFKSFIDKLPQEEEPSVFGMHENANISFQLQESRRLVKTILDVQPRLVSDGSGLTSEEIVSNTATKILEGLPEPIDIEIPDRPSSSGGNILAKLFAKDDNGRVLNSLSTVLAQETERFNALLLAIKLSLETLIKAVKGLVVMSSDLELVFSSLLVNAVPKQWADYAYPSLKSLSSWVVDLISRVDFVREWSVKGEPISFWIAGFFFPQGFLTGVLQNHARKYKIPIDSLTFTFETTNYMTQADVDREDLENAKEAEKVGGAAPEAKDGVLVRGLYMEGARWNQKMNLLQDSFPMEMFSVCLS